MKALTENEFTRLSIGDMIKRSPNGKSAVRVEGAVAGVVGRNGKRIYQVPVFSPQDGYRIIQTTSTYYPANSATEVSIGRTPTILVEGTAPKNDLHRVIASLPAEKRYQYRIEQVEDKSVPVAA